ncbi:MAG: hypothetical protein DMG74_21705 [Acidobacteria bacterium]|nr:MAG: hypothetical protein DMG74_21705 [Acidobacteriota bacterium]
MGKRRGNPNWGKPDIRTVPVATSFEEIVNTIGLSPGEYEGSGVLKEWVRRNKEHKYVPTDLLKVWGFSVKSEL